MNMKLIENLKLIILILISMQSKKIITSLEVKDVDPKTQEEYTYSVDFYNSKNSIRLNSPYDLHILNTEGKDTITLDRTVIFGRLCLPKNIRRIILINSIISGGIKFEFDLAEIEKVGYVVLGPLEAGIIESDQNFR